MPVPVIWRGAEAHMNQSTQVISHWYVLIGSMQASSLEFYKNVERSLQERETPDIKMTRVEWSEGGIFAARRQYLRISRGPLHFDVCAAPFGKGFFFSWWLTREYLNGWYYVILLA